MGEVEVLAGDQDLGSDRLAGFGKAGGVRASATGSGETDGRGAGDVPAPLPVYSVAAIDASGSHR
jgi:hypothetical protein